MDTITIPSPTAFLTKSPVPQTALIAPSTVKPAKPGPKKPISPSSTARPKSLTGGASSKPKQSKSRNGCITCKTKRLKCDETKPTCQQCHKRNVTCGGYKKDFKWKSFEETAVGAKPATKPKKSGPSPPSAYHGQRSHDFHESTSDGASSNSRHGIHQNIAAGPQPGPASHSPQTSRHESTQSTSPVVDHTMFIRGHDEQSLFPDDLPQTGDLFGIPGTTPRNDFFDDFESATETQPYTQGSSPRLIDLLSPGTDMNQPPPPIELRPPDSPQPYQPSGWTPLGHGVLVDDDVEEIIRTMDPEPDNQGTNLMFGPSQTMRARSPTFSESSSSCGSEMITLPRSLLTVGSPEMLIAHFDQQTCGILSIKDGPTENPWRTHIWPLAQQSVPLWYAITSMTAFHSSKEHPALTLTGVHHGRWSMNALQVGMSNMNLVDSHAAIATSLVLAFAESWDQHISSGLHHLRGAKTLINQHGTNLGSPSEASRFRFLCNTWLYMDVLAKLTSLSDDADGDDSQEFEELILNMNSQNHEIDPLLGCAATLFPLIGRVGSLVMRVRTTDSNSLAIISEATDLKTLIEEWKAPNPNTLDRPEDPSINIQHSLLTAEAYRYATLLYLHQAVPEIPSRSAGSLAREALKPLAMIPASSRTLIIHIYPLLAASCEITQQDDRRWVTQRWHEMTSRLRIGNVDKCVEVVQEVWRRRDAYESGKREHLERRERKRSTMIFPTHPEAAVEKRKAFSADGAGEMDSFFTGNSSGFDLPDMRRGAKRRATGDTHRLPRVLREPLQLSASTTPSGNEASRQMPANMTADNMEFEYTVRGHLHWVRVMGDRGWEVLLG